MVLYKALIIITLSTLIGYLLGRSSGRREGLRDGILFTPIILRKKSLERGRCTICRREYFYSLKNKSD